TATTTSPGEYVGCIEPVSTVKDWPPITRGTTPTATATARIARSSTVMPPASAERQNPRSRVCDGAAATLVMVASLWCGSDVAEVMWLAAGRGRVAPPGELASCSRERRCGPAPMRAGSRPTSLAPLSEPDYWCFRRMSRLPMRRPWCYRTEADRRG